jgi:HPt (histidine-containing phosphotransfer) domain-containing protein
LEEDVHVDPDIADLVPGYLRARAADVEELRAGLAPGDLHRVRVIGHNMAGSGEAYGFARLSILGRAIEEAALEGRVEDLSDLTDELADYLARLPWNIEG